MNVTYYYLEIFRTISKSIICPFTRFITSQNRVLMFENSLKINFYYLDFRFALRIISIKIYAHHLHIQLTQSFIHFQGAGYVILGEVYSPFHSVWFSGTNMKSSYFIQTFLLQTARLYLIFSMSLSNLPGESDPLFSSSGMESPSNTPPPAPAPLHNVCCVCQNLCAFFLVVGRAPNRTPG